MSTLDDLDWWDGANHFDQLCARQMEAARLLYENGCVTWPAEVASYGVPRWGWDPRAVVPRSEAP